MTVEIRRPQAAEWLPWILLGLEVLFLPPIYLLGPAARADLPQLLHFGWWESLVPLLAVELGLVGTLILRRHPRHAVGWLAVAGGFALSLNGFAGAYAGYSLSHSLPLPATWLALWLRGWLWYPALCLPSILLPAVFPDGSLPSRRWRPIVWAVAAGSAMQLALVSLTQALFGFPQADGPFPRLDWLLEPLAPLSGLLLFGGLLAALIALIARFRKSSGAARQQLKWFLLAIALQAALWVASGLTSAATHLSPYQNPYFDVLIPVSLLLLPLTIGVAVLRYRLYDIDLVISRSLAYAGLAVFIAAAYLVVVVGVGLVLGTGGRPNLQLSIVATAVVALVFQPIRTRLERLANRLVYGVPGDPLAILAEIARTPAGGDVEVALGQISQALARGLGSRQVSVRLRLPGGQERTGTWPAVTVGPFGRTFTVAHEGETLGEIEADASGDAALADALVVQAGLAFRTLRLSTDLATKLGELEAQAEELAASRTRLVQAEETERRRLERDLHDGIQQELVVLIAKARLARNQLERDPAIAAETLAELQGSARQALAALRALARGIHPAVLTSRGLVEAIEAMAARSSMNVRVAATPAVREARFAPEIEGAAYFVAAEALANVLKHSGASEATVAVSSDDICLRVVIADNGFGFEPDRVRESGLRGLRDRVEALGGHIGVETGRSGTRLEIALPIGRPLHV
jgi:signal transduction histidine kinase